ncbi:MAG: glycoside hydrolase family 5 protein [Chloroflexaceae bacterium]|nr:glycoside hydrolase family 5 protein [Chloroflexaceae bacterium]
MKQRLIRGMILLVLITLSWGIVYAEDPPVPPPPPAQPRSAPPISPQPPQRPGPTQPTPSPQPQPPSVATSEPEPQQPAAPAPPSTEPPPVPTDVATSAQPEAPVPVLPALMVNAHGMLVTNDGLPFEVRGVNYIQTSAADLKLCPELHFGMVPGCPWDIEHIQADLDLLQQQHVNTIRVFLNYYIFGASRLSIESYNTNIPLMRLEQLIDEANRRGIYVLPVLLNKYPQHSFDDDAYNTALAIHVRPVVERLASRSGILAWDLFNEPDIGSPVDIRCWDWSNADHPLCFDLANERLAFLARLVSDVRQLDPSRLMTISAAFAKNYFEPAGTNVRMADLVDLYAFHYYDNEPYDSGRYAQHWYYGAGFPSDFQRSIDELHLLNLQKPILMTEIGFPTGPGHTRQLPDLHRDLQTALQISRTSQTAGMILWPFQTNPEELTGGNLWLMRGQTSKR